MSKSSFNHQISQNGVATSNGHNHSAPEQVDTHNIQDHNTIKETRTICGLTADGVENGLVNSKELSALYSPAVAAKIWVVASKALTMSEPPSMFPEYTQPNGRNYVYRDAEFWTSGFFPGTLYELLYRSRKYPALKRCRATESIHPLKLEFACKWWTERLHSNASMTTTHDLGFMIAPWARPAWELSNDARAFDTLKLAARSLHSRFSPVIGLIRSWDVCITKRYRFQDTNREFLTVIDNMMNLDMLFYVASQTNDQAMWDAAVSHAKTTQTAHIRHDHSTTHLVVFDPNTGDIRERLTNQGYDDDSCWTRGQAWAIAGFAETYGWTKDKSFLETACRCADYFVARLPSSGVPPWDFDGAMSEDEVHPPDTSAALIAAYGLLLIYRALVGRGSMNQAQKYLNSALEITSAVCATHVDLTAHFSQSPIAVETVEHGISHQEMETICNRGGETIVDGATINNYKYAPRRWANHGLVYADYYFMVVGNLLLDLGIEGEVL